MALGTDESFFGFLYSDPKTGKTTDTGYAMPGALWLAEPGALKSVETVCGYKPSRHNVRTIIEMTKLVVELGKMKGKRFTGIVVDDMSQKAEAQLREFEDRKPDNRYKVFDWMRDALIDLRDAARASGLNILCNAHLNPPKETLQGKPMRGGPRLPGKMQEDLPGAVDVILMAQSQPSRRAWPFCYRNDPFNQSYVMGDRHNRVVDYAPMNFAELMRSAGYDIRRLPGAEWQEKIAEWMAGVLVPAATPTATPPIEFEQQVINEAVSMMTAAGITSEPMVDWALRDGLDRATIRRAHAVRRLSKWAAPSAGGALLPLTSLAPPAAAVAAVAAAPPPLALPAPPVPPPAALPG